MGTSLSDLFEKGGSWLPPKLHGFCDFLKPINCRKRPVMVNVLLIKKSSKCIEPCFIPWPVTRIHIFQKDLKNLCFLGTPYCHSFCQPLTPGYTSLVPLYLLQTDSIVLEKRVTPFEHVRRKPMAQYAHTKELTNRRHKTKL